MNKKLLTIFLSLFLVGILSVSCSNKDKTAPKGIEQYNGTYVSTSAAISGQYLWVSVKDSKVAIGSIPDQTSDPKYYSYRGVTGSGTDYNFSFPDPNEKPDQIQGTLKFSSDGSKVTVGFTKNTLIPDVVNKEFICNKR